MEIDVPTAARALGSGAFTLIRRGVDGSLVLSVARWRLAELTGQTLRFVGVDEADTPLELSVAELARVTWDQLPNQRVRSQVRFHLRSGDLWTFSGSVDLSALRG